MVPAVDVLSRLGIVIISSHTNTIIPQLIAAFSWPNGDKFAADMFKYSPMSKIGFSLTARVIFLSVF